MDRTVAEISAAQQAEVDRQKKIDDAKPKLTLEQRVAHLEWVVENLSNRLRGGY